MPLPTAPSSRPLGRSRTIALGGLALCVLAAGIFFWNRWDTKQAQLADGLRLVERKQWAEAIPPLESYRASSPDDVAALSALYQAKLNTTKHLVELDPLANRLCELLPNDPVPFSARCALNMMLGRFDEALRDGLQVLKLNPTDQAVRQTVVNLAFELGEAEVLERESAVLLNAGRISRVEYGVMLAQLAWKNRDLEAAQRYYREYVPPESQAPQALIMGGILLAEAGQHAEAVTRLRAGLAQAKLADRQLGLAQLAESLNQLGRTTEAQASLQELRVARDLARYTADARNLPNRLELQIRAAEACLGAGDPSQAVEILEAAAARGLASPELWNTLAQAYDKLSQPDRAAQSRRKAELVRSSN